MIKYEGYTEEEIKNLLQNNQDLGQAQERMERLKYELLRMNIQLKVNDIAQKGYFKIYE